ncbi:MAG: hypothetical protein IJV48_07230 [Ruminococcus sp.]|nr:hypothetical protein [Ruminococcus sp.]
MDIRLSDGDIALTPAGDCEYISGIDEAVQRVRIAVLTKKGSFLYDRELGTDYSGLSRDDSMLREKLDMRVKESCADIDGVQVAAVRLGYNRQHAIITVKYQNEESYTEVDLTEYIQ